MPFTKPSNEITQLNKPLLFNLYKSSKNFNVEPTFRAKLTQKALHYPELEIFKTQLEEELNDAHPHLYTEARQKLTSYRLIFAAFAFVFIIFSAAVYGLSSNWTYTLLFDTSIKAKWIVSTLAALMSIGSLACAFMPCSLHEATNYVVAKATRSLTHIYEKQRIQNNLSFLSFWGENARKSSTLRHMYKDVMDKVQERGEETYRLLKKIAKTPTIANDAKERLYNQALAELHDKIRFAIHSFNQLELDTTPLQHS